MKICKDELVDLLTDIVSNQSCKNLDEGRLEVPADFVLNFLIQFVTAKVKLTLKDNGNTVRMEMLLFAVTISLELTDLEILTSGSNNAKIKFAIAGNRLIRKAKILTLKCILRKKELLTEKSANRLVIDISKLVEPQTARFVASLPVLQTELGALLNNSAVRIRLEKGLILLEPRIYISAVAKKTFLSFADRVIVEQNGA